MRLLDGNLAVSHSQVHGGTSGHKGDMAVASSKQRAVTDVPLEGWVRFGKILQEWREDVLGYKTRAAFVRDTGINLRLAQELENSPAYRAGTYTKWALEDAEKAYQVTRESMLAVLRGEADTLVRAKAVSVRRSEIIELHGLPPAPFDDPEREAAVLPYFEAIWGRYLDLPKRITDPSGAQLGLSADDAKVFDGSRGAMSLGDRFWLVADVQLGRVRNADPETGISSA